MLRHFYSCYIVFNIQDVPLKGAQAESFAGSNQGAFGYSKCKFAGTFVTIIFVSTFSLLSCLDVKAQKRLDWPCPALSETNP